MACVALLTGCGGNSRSKTVVASVPDNGIVHKADFLRLKQSGGIAIYNGKSNGVSYSWTFVGRDIQKPSDMNLKLSYQSATAEQAGTAQPCRQITLAQKGSFPGAASLSITVGKNWAYGSYPLYTGQTNALQQAGTADVVSGVATMRLSQNAGPYYLSEKPTTSATSSNVAASGASSAVSGTASGADSASSTAASSSSSSAGGQAASKSGGSAATASSSAQNAGSTSAQAQASAAPAPQAPAASVPSVPQTIQVSLAIDCKTAVQNWSKITSTKQDHRIVPADGIILPQTTARVNSGKTVYDLLVAVCEQHGIQMEHKGSSLGQYIEGINNLYEFDVGPLSGWDYEVNGVIPGYAVSQYVLKTGDAVQFRYTCDLGNDLG